MTLDELRELAEKERQEQKNIPHKVNVCVAAACLSLRSDQVLKAMQSEVKKRGIEDKVRVKGVGCMGLCARGPLVLTEPQHTYYQSLKADDTEALGAILENLDGKPVPEFALSPALPFFASQQKIVLENCGEIDPERIEDYIAADGYSALLTCLSSRTREDVVQELIKSGLRGRGGGGYPTGLKWSMVSKAPGAQKYVICNGDEGDPGAFMDRIDSGMRSLSRARRYGDGRVAVGAHEGIFYCRARVSSGRQAAARCDCRRKNAAGWAQHLGDSSSASRLRCRRGRRRVCLRRRDGADRLGGRPARRAAAASAVPCLLWSEPVPHAVE